MVDPQNINARYIDKFNSGGTTSIRTHAPPGGKSNFSLGWGMDTKEVESKKQTKSNEDLYSYNSSSNTSNTNTGKTFKNLTNKPNEISQQPIEKTSVRVKYAPGGQSSIKFG